MTATDIQFLVNAAHSHLVVPGRVTFKTFELFRHHQGIAVNTDNLFTELAFKIPERVINQHFTAFMANGDVLVIRLEKLDFSQWNQLDTTTGLRTDMGA